MGMTESYVPAHLAIEAMRDNGYKNTAYAVAELIDNSIQASATSVELLCAEADEEINYNKLRRLNQIAVLDNGKGMDAEVLKIALQFGNGTRLSKKDRTGIGRFGMGLPASSISQCKRVDVWSWQNGVDSALHTYLDVDEIRRQERTDMPDPANKPIPDIWKKVASSFGETGTLVVWTRLDRLMWRKANTLIENSEFLIGRMYRNFLHNGSLKIRMVAFNRDNVSELNEKFALPNDPGYLMAETSCPAPFDKTPMFNPHGEPYEVKYKISFKGEEHEVIVRFSIAKDEARERDQAGSTAYGRHAARNTGISIVRAGRELELDQSQVIKYNTTERWWGIEIEFPPSLDELMGVTNNKQSARNFAEIMTLDFDSLMRGNKTENMVMQELQDEGDPRAPLVKLAIKIKNELSQMRALLRIQTKGNRGGKDKRHDLNPERAATELTSKRKEAGYTGTSDEDENEDPELKKMDIAEELKESGVDPEEAEDLAAQTVSNSLKYSFSDAAMESDAFFSVRPAGGAINIILNKRHPAFENLVEVLQKDNEGADVDELGARLHKASDGLKLLLMAWARYEDELTDGPRKQTAQDARSDWGRVARAFMQELAFNS